MNRTTFIITLMLVCVGSLKSQGNHLWSTHGFSKFVYTPGIEGNYFFNSKLGIQMGASMYIQSEDLHIINVSHLTKVNYYDTNIGLVGNIYSSNNQNIGLTLGAKLYYGPLYKKLVHYEIGNYDIYTDVSHLRPEYGLDLGAYYTRGHFSVLIKFDTAYKIVRFGLGYCFWKEE